MTAAFKGRAVPISDVGFGVVAEELRVFAPEIWAILSVETRGAGFLVDRRPLILFERHVFHRQTNGKFSDQHPDISNSVAGGYGQGGAAQHDRLQRAVALDRSAALQSASWGIGQVMGANFAMVGYDDVDSMVAAMTRTEDEQLRAMASYIDAAGLASALRAHNWPSFARGYNGPRYAENHYDSRLASAHARFARGPLPDLAVRRAQLLLLYLGYHPGPVDGVVGRFTRDALLQFQTNEKLSETGALDSVTAARLDERAKL